MTRSRIALTAACLLAAAPALDAQCLVASLAGSSVLDDEEFGSAVDVDGDVLVVGAHYHDSARGAAFVFERVGGNWVETAELTAPGGTPPEFFGEAVAAEGVRVFVGKPLYWSAGTPGAVYVYVRAGGSWTLEATLVASDGHPGDLFGLSLAVEGEMLLVGAPLNGAGGLYAGAVYVFERSGSTWTETDKWLASDAKADAQFGGAVSLEGDTAVVGASFHDGAAPESGAAYVRVHSAGTWVEVQKLVQPSAGLKHHFGEAVGISGTTVLVSAPNQTDTISADGVVHAFDRRDTGWIHAQKLTASDPQGNTALGARMAVDGDTAVFTGSFWDNVPVHVFRRTANGWAQTSEVPAPQTFYSPLYGTDVALRNETLVVGAVRDGDWPDFEGRAHVFSMPRFDLAFCHCDAGSPCGNEDPLGGCKNTTGAGAELRACGSASVVADDLLLITKGVPPNAFALMAMGDGTGSLPVGNGKMCVTSGGLGLFRFPVRVTGTDGVVVEGPGLVAHTFATFPPAGQISAGQTWSFQTWFRDPAGPCGASSNLANALAVTFGL